MNKKSRKSAIFNNRGGALLAVVIISLLLVGVTMWFVQWSWTHTKEAVHSRGVQSALEYAESGIEGAQQYIRQPGPVISTTPYVATETMSNGRFEYSVVAKSPGARDLEAYATGYSYAAQGAFEDPVTHQRCQMAVIHARLKWEPFDKPMIAVPRRLKINPGTTTAGFIYADNLVFVPPPDSEHPERVAKSLYTTSINREDGTPDPNPSYVVFGSTPEQAGYPLRFPRLTPAIRDYYRNLADPMAGQLHDGASLDGTVPAPSTTPVYFCDGDLHVGRAGPVMAGGSLVVYVTGQLILHDVIDMRGPFWIVFLVEKDIVVDNQTQDNFVLNGTYMTNGKIVCKNQHRSGNLTVTGSLIAGEGIDLASGWDNGRMYNHRRAFPAVPLPRLTQLVEYTILQGKYQ